jgi:CDP-diacylglycerol--serine O-phosphatidyltransferase
VRRPVEVLPTVLTLGNTFCGTSAVFFTAAAALQTDPAVANNYLFYAAGLIFIGMVFDAFDGQVARMTNSVSDLGGQLDSLSDMITFGVAPALLVRQIFAMNFPGLDHPLLVRLLWLLAGLYVLCAALRLARFNVETATGEDPQHKTFRGLPTPAAAGVIAALVLILCEMRAEEMHWGLDLDYYSPLLIKALPALALVLAILMVSNIRYVHVLNRLRGKKNFLYLIQFLFAVIFFFMWPQLSLAVGFIVYVISGPVAALYFVATGTAREKEEAEEGVPGE